MNLRDKLAAMVDQTYMYKTRHHKILSFRLDGKLTIVTDKGWIEFELEKAEKNLKEFLPVEAEPDTSLVVLPKRSELVDLKATLLENIKKVREDKSYISQANSINQSITTLINMAKVEISCAKLCKR